MSLAGLREAVAAGDVYIVGAEDALLGKLLDVVEAAQVLYDRGESGGVLGRLGTALAALEVEA